MQLVETISSKHELAI